MRQTRPALLALVVLLLAASATVAVAAALPADRDAPADATPVVRDQVNATNYLDIERGEVERAGYGDSSLDVGAAVQMDVERLRGDYERRAFDAAYADSTQRTDRLRAEVDRLDARADALAARQDRVVEAYNAGELTTAQFLRELAVVDVTAREVDAQLQRLEDRPDVLLPSALENRVFAIQTDLIPLTGEARALAAAALRGERPGGGTYVVTAERGFVVASMDGDRFVREATLPENHGPAGQDNFVTDEDPTGVNNANDRARELYPWTYANSLPGLQRKATVYTVSLDHPHGSLVTYLDGASTDVFSERQTLRVDRLPTESTANLTGSVALRVNRTYGTGPMRVAAADPVTGESLDAVVVVNGDAVGRTGADGAVWTVTPQESVRIRVYTGVAVGPDGSVDAANATGTARVNFFAR